MHRTNSDRDARRITDGVHTFWGGLLPRNRARPLPESLERWSGFVLIAAAHAIEERYAHAASVTGISLRDFVVLAEIARHPGLSQSTLSWRLGLSRSRVSEQLLVLDSAGYVRRDINPLDLRKRKIWLSSEAQRLVEDITERLDKLDEGWLRRLDYPRKRTTFVAALRRLPPAASRR